MKTFETGQYPEEIYVCPKCRFAYYGPTICSVNHEEIQAIRYNLDEDFLLAEAGLEDLSQNLQQEEASV